MFLDLKNDFDNGIDLPFGLNSENFMENYDAVINSITPRIQERIDLRRKI